MWRIALLLATLVAIAGRADAQLPKPLPFAVVDVRGFYGGLGQDPTTAAGLNELFPNDPVTPADFPRRGPGGVIGAHLYLLRKRNLALGIGAEGVLTQGRAAQEVAGVPTGVVVRQRLQGTSGMVSLNFGHRDGWSYVSAGMGPLAFYTYRGDLRPAEPPPFQMTINLGAGARWFATRHVAFCFDLRFYQTEPQEATASYPPRQRTQLRVLSAGISIR